MVSCSSAYRSRIPGKEPERGLHKFGDARNVNTGRERGLHKFGGMHATHTQEGSSEDWRGGQGYIVYFEVQHKSGGARNFTHSGRVGENVYCCTL